MESVEELRCEMRRVETRGKDGGEKKEKQKEAEKKGVKEMREGEKGRNERGR